MEGYIEEGSKRILNVVNFSDNRTSIEQLKESKLNTKLKKLVK